MELPFLVVVLLGSDDYLFASILKLSMPTFSCPKPENERATPFLYNAFAAEVVSTESGNVVNFCQPRISANGGVQLGSNLTENFVQSDVGE